MAAHGPYRQQAGMVLRRDGLMPHKDRFSRHAGCRSGQSLRRAEHLIECVGIQPQCGGIGDFMPVIGADRGGGENTGGNMQMAICINTPHGAVQRHWEGGILLRGWRAGGFRLAGNIGCVHGQFSKKMVSGCGGGWR